VASLGRGRLEDATAGGTVLVKWDRVAEQWFFRVPAIECHHFWLPVDSVWTRRVVNFDSRIDRPFSCSLFFLI